MMEIDKIVNNINSTANVGTIQKKNSDDSFEKHLQSAFTKQDQAELKKVCQEFEGIMLNMLYKQMKATVPKSDLIAADAGRDIFQSMLDEKLVDEVAKSGGVGLSDTLYKQLSSRLKNTYKLVAEGDK